MQISEVSEKYDISADTLRYYERIGLIPPVTRTGGGIRDYGEEDLKWVEFATCMRNAGLSIEALIEYVRLFEQGDGTIEARKTLLVEEREQLREKYEAMGRTLARLDEKIGRYDSILLRKEQNLSGYDG